MERRQDVSMVRLHYVLLEHQDKISRVRNNDVISVRLLDVSNETPIDVSVVRILDVPLVRLYDVSCTLESQTSVYNYYKN